MVFSLQLVLRAVIILLKEPVYEPHVLSDFLESRLEVLPVSDHGPQQEVFDNVWSHSLEKELLLCQDYPALFQPAEQMPQ